MAPSGSFINPPEAVPNASVAGSSISTARITGLAALPYLEGHYDTVTGPGFERINMSWFKEIPTVHEEVLEMRADVFNVPEHASLWRAQHNDGCIHRRANHVGAVFSKLYAGCAVLSAIRKIHILGAQWTDGAS